MAEVNGEAVVAELGKLLGPGSDLLDPARLKRVVFRADSPGRVKDLAGYRKSHTLPERANDWARKFVNRIAGPDIKADLDNTFDMVRETFGYKRKDLDVSAERDGLGFIRTPDFEYTVTVMVNPDEPEDVIWRREVGRLSGPEFVRSEGFRNVFGTMFNKLVFEFAAPVDVAEFVDRIEDAPPEGAKVSVASDSGRGGDRRAGGVWGPRERDPATRSRSRARPATPRACSNSSWCSWASSARWANPKAAPPAGVMCPASRERVGRKEVLLAARRGLQSACRTE